MVLLNLEKTINTLSSLLQQSHGEHLKKNFLKNSNVISNLKVRASYGTDG